MRGARFSIFSSPGQSAKLRLTILGRGAMVFLARCVDWICELFACSAENDLRINQLIAHLSGDPDD